MQPIIKEKVRILRPIEYESLRNTLKPEYQTLLDGLLLSGLRYVEGKALQGHNEWLDRSFIKTQSLKAKTKFKERWVRLSSQGVLIMPNFIRSRVVLPTRQTWDENLKRWAKEADIDPIGICSKTTRKTWESWLVFYYPINQVVIAQSQGHDRVTQVEHYLNLPFDDADKLSMKKWVDGWI